MKKTIKMVVTIDEHTGSKDPRTSSSDGKRINKDDKTINELPNSSYKGDRTDPRINSIIGTRTNRAMEWHRLRDNSTDSIPTCRGRRRDTWGTTPKRH